MIRNDDEWAERADAAVDAAKEGRMSGHKYEAFMGKYLDIDYVCGREPPRWDPQSTRQTARVYHMGCGFAFQVVVVAFNGEDIWTYSQTCGHTMHVTLTQVLADSPIEVISASGISDDHRRAIAERFLAWLPPGLREHKYVVDLVLTDDQ